MLQQLKTSKFGKSSQDEIGLQGDAYDISSYGSLQHPFLLVITELPRLFFK